mgnify:CR=1 FL=1
MIKKIDVPWGTDTVQIAIPDSWNISGILRPMDIPPVSDYGAEMDRAVSQPVGSASLPDLVRSSKKIAIVIDDSSRPTPVHLIFPHVLNFLYSNGVKSDQITLVPAIGLHRGLDEKELNSRIGGVLSGLRWENPDCDKEDTLTYLGMTSRGTPVWINQSVSEADLILSIGCIEPHIIASFGGGLKNLVPGVAGRKTIAHNHSLNCSPSTFNMVGQPIENNPMRLDLEEAALMLKSKIFIINAVLNYQKKIVKIVAGDGIKAHREGVLVSKTLYGVNLDKPVDIVITDSHPMDQDLRQGVKALANTVRAVKKGGYLITVVRAEEGVGVFGLANRRLPLSKKALRILAPLLVKIVPKAKLKNMGEEDRFFLYFALQAMRHANLLMHAPTIPDKTRENLPFVTFVNNLSEAIDAAKAKYPEKANLVVFPYGGITYPDFS